MPRQLRRIWLASEIADVHKASSGTYGALRVTAELKHGRAIAVGHTAVSLIHAPAGHQGPTDKTAAQGEHGLRRSPRLIASGASSVAAAPISCG